MIAELYTDKERRYFGYPREELWPFFEGRGLTVLDIGCGEGAMLEALKKQGIATETVGVEIDQQSAKLAEKRVDKIYTANVEEQDLPYKSYFDVVILADILEHTIDPWLIVERCFGYLKPGGYVVSSVPNIRNYFVLKPLLFRGSWTYADQGLMDKGHLRFFTRSEVEKLFAGAGFVVERMRFNYSRIGWKFRLFQKLTFGVGHDFFVQQFLLKARKPEAHG